MYLFIITHPDSGSGDFCKSLNDHPLCHWHHNDKYETISDVVDMKNKYKKIFFDHILYNWSLSPYLYKVAKLIYLVGKPVGDKQSYYFRLRRIYEMSVKYPGLLLKPEELDVGKLWDFLGVKPMPIKLEIPDKRSEKKYEKYMNLISLHCPS
jgi:hypothetical protein